MIRQLKTKKLFYNKWPIKVECHLAGASWITRFGTDRFIEWCIHGELPKDFNGRVKYDRQNLIKFAKIFSQFEEKDLQIRSEGSHFNIFLKDLDLLTEIEKAITPWIVAITKPQSSKEFEFLINNSPKKTICEQLPYEKYKYKVTLKENTPPETKMKFLEWLRRYNDQVHVSNSSLQWLEHKKKWVQAPFFYVESDKHLSMVLLYLGNHVRKSQEFIIESSINS